MHTIDLQLGEKLIMAKGFYSLPYDEQSLSLAFIETSNKLEKILMKEKNISSVSNNDNDRKVVADSKWNDDDLLFDLQHSPH